MALKNNSGIFVCGWWSTSASQGEMLTPQISKVKTKPSLPRSVENATGNKMLYFRKRDNMEAIYFARPLFLCCSLVSSSTDWDTSAPLLSPSTNCYSRHLPPSSRPSSVRMWHTTYCVLPITCTTLTSASSFQYSYSPCREWLRLGFSLCLALSTTRTTLTSPIPLRYS